MRSIAFPIAFVLAIGTLFPAASAACEPRQDATPVGDDHYAIVKSGSGYDQLEVPPISIRDAVIVWSQGQWAMVYEETNGREGLQTEARGCNSGADKLVAKSYFGYGGASIGL